MEIAMVGIVLAALVIAYAQGHKRGYRTGAAVERAKALQQAAMAPKCTDPRCPALPLVGVHDAHRPYEGPATEGMQ